MTQRFITASLIWIIGFSVSSVSAWAADSRESEVLKAQESFARCWAQRDPDCMDKVLSPDFTYAFRSGFQLGRAGFLAAIKAGRYQGTSLSTSYGVEGQSIHFYGPVALIISAAQARTLQTLVWSNADGHGWKLVRGQGTVASTAQK